MVLDNGFVILYAKIAMLKLHLPSKKPLIMTLIVVVVLAFAAVPSYYFYNKYQKSQEMLKNPTEAARQEVKTLVESVSRYIELPNEEPTVATVSDKAKLKDQPFFAKAENGDKVLIYTQARKAILFRPSTNKIIEVSTVNLGQTAGANASTQASTVKVAIYNGTNTSGLTVTAEKLLKEKISNLDIVAKENAKKKDFEKTIVVVLSKGREKEAKAIAGFLGVKELSLLPEDEVKPESEILIILGSDYIK